MAFRNSVFRVSQLIADEIIGALIATAASGARWVLENSLINDGTYLNATMTGYSGSAHETTPAVIAVGNSATFQQTALQFLGALIDGVVNNPRIVIYSDRDVSMSYAFVNADNVFISGNDDLVFSVTGQGTPKYTLDTAAATPHEFIGRASFDDGITNFTGMVTQFAGAVVPTGALLCDGASYLRADYPDLFAVIGVTYGSVDATHFNVPEARNRVPMGASGTKPLGSAGGADSAAVPNHDHTVPAHSHPLSTSANATLGGAAIRNNATNTQNSVAFNTALDGAHVVATVPSYRAFHFIIWT